MAGTQALYPRADDGAAAAAASSDLAHGLLLVRASTVQMLRLQLAIERRDRAVALRSLDDLVALDAHIADLAGNMPSDPALDSFALEVEEQRAALLRERFGLAAGFDRRAEPLVWAEPQPAPKADPELAPPAQLLDRIDAWRAPDPPPPLGARTAILLAAAFLLLATAGVAAAMILGWRPGAIVAQIFSQGV